MSHDANEVLPPHLIHDALERVIGSQGIQRIPTGRSAFSKFIVQETLAGNADRIKAYTIAVDVFGRDPSFDPGVRPDGPDRGRSAAPLPGALLPDRWIC